MAGQLDIQEVGRVGEWVLGCPTGNKEVQPDVCLVGWKSRKMGVWLSSFLA